jgi:hypothetical protein
MFRRSLGLQHLLRHFQFIACLRSGEAHPSRSSIFSFEAIVERVDPSKVDASRSGRTWRRFVAAFLTVFIGGTGGIYLFILLVDPYDVIPFSLPMERRIVSISQRYMYPQIVRSGQFDAVVIGTSTSRLINPEILNGHFGYRFANLSMDAMTAWEQRQVIELFLRDGPRARALLVGLDTVWCSPNADKARVTPRGFPEWLYDEFHWNDYLYLLNYATLEIAMRLAGHKLGLYRERVRYDGFGVFVPPDDQYDEKRASELIWPAGAQAIVPQVPAVTLSDRERNDLPFPAMAWLDDMLAALPEDSEKLLVFMPVHIAAQPRPGDRAAAIEDECKARVVDIARNRGAVVADWRIHSALTSEDLNYWDNLHYRLPIANRIARDVATSIRAGQDAPDGAYKILFAPAKPQS